MTVIENNAQLMQYIPNVVSAVEGEDTLYDKISSHMDAAASWFFRYICKGSAVTTELLPLVRSVVAAEAFRAALPSLNVILTANGFGIVSNQSTAPASKERTESLVEALIAQRDNAIEQLAFELNGRGTPFDGTVFRGFEAQRMQGFNSHLLDKFMEQRSALIRLQTTLAMDALSTAVCSEMTALTYADEAERPGHINRLFAFVPDIIVRMLKGQEVKADVRRVVEYIRTHEAEFPGWADTQTAKHWADYTYKNDKKSGGFWL